MHFWGKGNRPNLACVPISEHQQKQAALEQVSALQGQVDSLKGEVQALTSDKLAQVAVKKKKKGAVFLSFISRTRRV